MLCSRSLATCFTLGLRFAFRVRFGLLENHQPSHEFKLAGFCDLFLLLGQDRAACREQALRGPPCEGRADAFECVFQKRAFPLEFFAVFGQPVKVVVQDLLRLVERAMAQLPEDQRTAIVLKEYHGMTFQEIADLVGCPLSTVKTRLYQGLTVLRRELAKSAGRVA